MTRPVSAWGIIAGIVVGGAFGLTATVALATKPPTPGLSTYALPTADLRLLDRAPYRVQQPTDLPSGMTLAAVSVVGPPETKGGVFSVDMTWTDANGHAIHVWQTNMTEYIGTSLDPVVGAPVTVGAARGERSTTRSVIDSSTSSARAMRWASQSQSTLIWTHPC